MIPLLWAIATVTFFLMQAIPGGPFDQEKQLPPQTLKALEGKYHLDGTVIDQYGSFISQLVRGDLGISFRQDRPVTEVMADGAAPTIQLGACAFVFAVLVGGTLGVFSAMNDITQIAF